MAPSFDVFAINTSSTLNGRISITVIIELFKHNNKRVFSDEVFGF